MTDGEPQQIPDLWEPLAKLAWWVRHIYGLEGDVIRYVVLALRRGPHLRIAWPPPHGPKIVQGSEWDKIPRRNVTVNWGSGHLVISDPDNLDNPLQQFPIEVEWEAVIDAVSGWERQQRNAAAYAVRALAIAPKPTHAPEASPAPSEGPPVAAPAVDDGDVLPSPSPPPQTPSDAFKVEAKQEKAPGTKLTPRQLLADALVARHKDGRSILSPGKTVDALHTEVGIETKIKVAKITFERALRDARKRILGG